MDTTPFEHAIAALMIQLIVSALTGDWWLGAAIAATTFIIREHTQAEYRWISEYGGGKRANMPWWGAFDPRVWSKLDPWLDWIMPTVFVIAVALF